MSYRAPVEDMMLSLAALGIEAQDYQPILEEAGKLAADVLAPLNWTGDQEGLTLKDGELSMPKGFKQAYDQYRDGGWNAVPFPEKWGGMELPYSVAFPVQEMWQAANMSFGLCPLLNQGAVEALIAHGSEELQQRYLEKLVSGEWTGTMNLTEPQAGSDLSLLKAKAIPQDDNTYKITGQKIYITYGEHDLAENIIHLVLARLPDAPEGTKGISLFLVPKILPDGTRNDLTCVSTEHKLGIHASPTCTMSFGDDGGATGWLIGEENKGLACMFTMMNNARLSVGLQGVAISDRALQAARHYAAERKQGKDVATGETTAIENHPDVQRQLMSMQALTEAGRLLTYYAAHQMDLAHHEGSAEAQALVALLTPIVKGFCTENSIEVTSTGIQVHGGMGYVEETGAAQYLRDARILPIYEGTNGIQAMDLAGYKLRKDNGATAKALIKTMRDQGSEKLQSAIDQLEKATDTLLKAIESKDMETLGLTAFDYMMGWGYVAAGWLLEKLAAQSEDKQKLNAFYQRFILPRASAHMAVIAFRKS